MNFSFDYKIIWYSAECAGGEILKYVFQNYGFYRFESQNSKKMVSLFQIEESNSENNGGMYNDYQKVVSIRNPYDRIWNCYLKFFTHTYNPSKKDENKEKFTVFLNKTFNKTINGITSDPFFGKDSYITKWTFLEYIPDEIIRYESMFNDVMNLSFVKNSPLKFEIDIFQEKINQIKLDGTFKDYYTYETAQKVFNFYRKSFLKFDYDPFSFTHENLSEKDKIKFVHGYE